MSFFGIAARKTLRNQVFGSSKKVEEKPLTGYGVFPYSVFSVGRAGKNEVAISPEAFEKKKAGAMEFCRFFRAVRIHK